MLWHKEHHFKGYPFSYVKQTNVKWRITDAFPNNGDLNSVFPPETALQNSYTYDGKTYETNRKRSVPESICATYGAHSFPAFTKTRKKTIPLMPGPGYIRPKTRKQAWIEFQNYGRSKCILAPPQGKWDYKGSRVWLNDRELLPPEWTATHTVKSNEIALGNENCVAREPLRVHLQRDGTRFS